jgi:hypothetical protein
MPLGFKAISQRLPEPLEDADNDLPVLARHLLAEPKNEHDQLTERSDRIEAWIRAWHTNNSVSQRLVSIRVLAYQRQPRWPPQSVRVRT